MFENLTGEVGIANHQARLIQAREPGRTTRMLDAANISPKRAHSRKYRKAVAERLIALAVRIAPSTQEQATHTTAAAATQ